ncbi:DUF1492 domain-containing protein [Gorillibacterium timonense]|uniref:DUF1492 domain-containing protein n=1 Tax=Gorillibacterium timonense TaxID=1689269 RepID=UPI00071CE9D4|nr:DUF1492 domain-containing protein [Gorillibacterium timonense]
MNHDQVISQLKGYKRIVGRIKYLEKYPVGGGIRLSSISQDDNLQTLHRQLRGMPTYLYLNKREQELETTAHAYLTRYPAGTKAQLREVQGLYSDDREDERKLREVEQKIRKVLETRTGQSEGYHGVLERLSEIQDLEQEKEQIDNALEALGEYKPHYADLLRLRYIEGKAVDQVADDLAISRVTFFRWKTKSLEEYANVAGID